MIGEGGNSVKLRFKRLLRLLQIKKLSKPYKNRMSNIGFFCIGNSSELRKLPVTKGRLYVPFLYSLDPKTNKFTNFTVTGDSGKLISIADSDIGSIFNIVSYVKG